MCHLPQWQNVPPKTAHRPMVNPTINLELSNEQISHVKHLKNQSLTNELKRTFIREYLKNYASV